MMEDQAMTTDDDIRELALAIRGNFLWGLRIPEQSCC
jgi:hypothetical protein